MTSRNRRLRSIFEIFNVGRGPSSTHSMGPFRAARIFLDRCPEHPARVRVTLLGSLAATCEGHMTDQSIAAALEGIDYELIRDTRDQPLPHPNTMRFEAFDQEGRSIAEWEVYSVGAGNLEDSSGTVGGGPDVSYPFSTIREAMDYCEEHGLLFWQVVERTETDLWPRLERIWERMRASVEQGLASDQVVLPGSLKLRRRAKGCLAHARMLESPQRDVALISAYALAVAEENANGAVVVTAPSCGSSGVVPGVLYYFEENKNVPRREILQALATAGLFGTVIRAHASISGAEVGCQGEIGSACSMAAAAASQLLGGTLFQIEYAAEIAMEHHLGLTCDPVEGYVQIPCIERNMTAALRAFECATFSLLTDGRHLISFDDVIAVMDETGHDLQQAYRETGRGGLALLWQRRRGTRPPRERTSC